MPAPDPLPIRVTGDFNGLFGDLLCLSHRDTVTAEDGTEIALAAGMQVTAFEPDSLPGEPKDEVLASGVVEPAPDWLACNGSKWVLRIDGRGVRHLRDG